ncbi:hypothetical protein [Chondromyces apiculatus]|uniref:hypothetical protein n=1 Tax=Chondromyces apiculatus TaxID=51 RepID=UPI0012DC0E5A|nr:hypothetical protein [Chondromyces apiculatus]
MQQLASEVHPGRDGHAADLAVLLDDLELENADQPEIVVASVRAAVKQHLEALRQRESAAKAQRVEQALRERASFHLAAPMIEAWLFADPASLPLAGVGPDRLPPKLRPGVDPEAFETDDLAFSQDDGTTCAAFHAQNARRRKPERLLWMLPERFNLPGYRRELHPKAYLSWLCRNPTEAQRGSTYRESHGGAAGLRALSWEQVLRTPAHAKFARALIHDLADALGPPTLTLPSGEEYPLLARSSAPRDRALRNL